MRHKLVLHTGYEKYNGWNWTLCRMLASSRMFNIKTTEFPYDRVKGSRNSNWCTMEVNGVRVGLDTWDTLSPTSHFYGANFFNKRDGIYKDIKLLIKIQYHKCRFWDEFTNNTGIPVTAWTVMPTKDFKLGYFKWENKNHKWYGTVTGKNNRFGRQPWSNWCADQDDFYSSGDYLVNDSIESYFNRLKECKWGIILKGKRGAEKNRRECEFSSCGIPLALNYDPCYPFPIKAGVHYVKLNKPDDMANLRDINPEPYAEASRRLYFDHFSPYGMAKTLINLVENHK